MRRLLIIFVLLSFLLVIGQGCNPVCNKPYILVGNSCCLDVNDNNICDTDESLEQEAQIEKDIVETEPTEMPEIEKDEHIEGPVQEYTIADLKSDLNKVFWEEGKTWRTSDVINLTDKNIEFIQRDYKGIKDNNSLDIVFYKYGFYDLIIMDSSNQENYTFDDFVNTSFSVCLFDNWNVRGDPEIWDRYFKDINLSTIKVKDSRNYWIYRNSMATSQSLNYMCSPRLYVKVPLDCPTEDMVSSGKNKLAMIEAGFNSVTKDIISELYKATLNCPLTKKYAHDIFTLQKEINAQFVTDYPFDVKEIGEDAIIHTTINDDRGFKEYDEIKKVYHKRTYDYQKITISELSKLKIMSSEDLNKFLKLVEEEDTQLLQTRSREKNNSFEGLTAGDLDSVKKETMVQFNEIYTIDKDTIEVLRGSFDEYEVKYVTPLIYSVGDIIRHYAHFNVIHKIVFKCKEDLILEVYSNTIDYSKEDYSEQEVDNSIEVSRNNLLMNLNKVKEACSKI